MSLSVGARFGVYEIVSSIGAGGMGEVYRARDTRLHREVAIKILPPAYAGDAERLTRFEREARTLAALNHPNIAQIYGVEEAADSHALVMELVDGDDLSMRIARGSMPLSEVLPTAPQIVDALEAAHDLGIIHRDLKPANIKIRDDGTVKVLDFGLAKELAADSAIGADPGIGGLYNSPTMTSPARTAIGMILGTVAYMAPEQAKGRAVDRRADIWAFGVVLYEMLTGRACFAGDSVGELLAAVMKDTPDLDRLPPGLPAALRRLLLRCLEKDPRRRLSAVGDARWDLEEAAAREASTPMPAKQPGLAWIPWAAAVGATAIAVWALATRTAPGAAVVEGHFTIDLPDHAALVTDDTPHWSDGPLAVAPDGRHIVYVAPNGSDRQLFVRAMTDLTPRALAGTDAAHLPFFSPDGRWIGFFAGGKLKKVPLAGGTPASIADALDGRGATWGPDGEIVFAPTKGSGLFAVPEAGGTPRRVTTLDQVAGDDLHGWPQLLPRHGVVLFSAIAWSRETSDIVTVNLKTGERRLVQKDASFARYVPAADGAGGHLIFVRNGALVAAPFDPGRAEPAGTAVTVLDGVRQAQFDISSRGVLAYASGSSTAPDFSLVWVDRAGVVTPINDLPRGYEDLNLSPDGRRVALTIEEAGPDSPAQVWMADTERRTITRFTFEGLNRDPVWAPDGQSILYGSNRGDAKYGMYVQRLDGRSPPERAWASPTSIWPDPQSWTPDGQTLVFTTKGAETGDDIWTLSTTDHVARPWLATPATEWTGRLSPNGKWIAYNSSESGQTEVYVQAFPGPGTKRLVSQGGGFNAIWSRDGRELFYRQAAKVLVVSVDADATFTSGVPAVLFSGRFRATGRDFDVSPDGSRFVMMRAINPRTTNTLRVLLDWRHVLESRLKGIQ